MDSITYTAFAGWRRVARGTLAEMLRGAKTYSDAKTEHGGKEEESLLIFEDQTGKQVDFDMRGSVEEVIARVTPKSGPGRPKLGVTSREISLLPRHWQWLERQPQGASAALRRLVDAARQKDGGETEKRGRIDAAGRFMTALAGNFPGFEEAYRALYAQDRARLEHLIDSWPTDVRQYIGEQVF